MPTARQQYSGSSLRAPISDSAADLAFSVELWNRKGTRRELVVGRAADLKIANAIFTAAMEEWPGRLVLLKQGARTLQSSS